MVGHSTEWAQQKNYFQAFMTGNADILRLLLQHRLEEEDEDFDDEDDQEENNTRFDLTNVKDVTIYKLQLICFWRISVVVKSD